MIQAAGLRADKNSIQRVFVAEAQMRRERERADNTAGSADVSTEDASSDGNETQRFCTALSSVVMHAERPVRS